MNSEQLLELVTTALEDIKAQNIRTLDVRGKTTLADFMVIASGTSGRHVQSAAESVALEAKKAGIQPLGVEGQESQEWVLVDLNDVIVHVMLPETRDFYNLEKLWLAEEAADTEKAAPEDPSLERVRRLRG
ncbi:ribosome silencing factor [Thioalkalivibrio sp. ARh3]|uniref:ribosome silencing factor n=1 Tax=Thioalkalivibrio sp. ARh3 TaxID=1158148 RepID=UPI0003747059|nr:ribosome silencing factor [Thioalkalivibrio sp. ARh3]